jgi:predicted ester cyclase
MTARSLYERLSVAAKNRDIDELHRISGNDRLAESFRRLCTGFPDVEQEQEWIMVDEPKVSAWLHLTGTHLGPWRGLEPTGRRIDARAQLTIEVVDDVVADHWIAADWLGIAMQIGVPLLLPTSTTT